ncbi:MAG: Asp23/Gls24 family envelope stress response protein [Candidatus Bipolaricaulia bacterium]
MMAELEPIQEELGEIFIADEVVELLIYKLISETAGLSPPNRVGGEDDLLSTLSKVYRGKGIKIHKKDDRLWVKLSLIAKYGIKITEAAQALTQRIEHEVRRMTGLVVSGVEIEIADIEL